MGAHLIVVPRVRVPSPDWLHAGRLPHLVRLAAAQSRPVPVLPNSYASLVRSWLGRLSRRLRQKLRDERRGCSQRFFKISFWRFIAICVLLARNRVVMDASFVLLRRSGTRHK